MTEIECSICYENINSNNYETCSIEQCGVHTCIECRMKDDTGDSRVTLYKCPYCRNIDWKYRFSGILFYIRVGAYKRMGMTEEEAIEKIAREMYEKMFNN